ncbi:MAG: hypothetical protein QMD71_05855 [bacterium]|nr:hypothetical protein [bacterium]
MENKNYIIAKTPRDEITKIDRRVVLAMADCPIIQRLLRLKVQYLVSVLLAKNIF